MGETRFSIGTLLASGSVDPGSNLRGGENIFHLALYRKIRICSFVVEIQSMQFQCIVCMLIIDDATHIAKLIKKIKIPKNS